MKLFTVCIFLLVAHATAAPSAVKQDEEDPMEFEVEVDVECEGDGTKKINLHNGVYAGKALAESFNKVHSKSDGGDHVLKHVVLGGNLDHVMEEGEAAEKKATETDASVKSWWWNYGFYYFGGYSCRLCYEPDDDTLGVASRERENEVHKAWEKEFQAMLDDHPNDAFEGVTNCRIIVITEPSLMRPRPAGAPEVFYDLGTDDKTKTEVNPLPAAAAVLNQDDPDEFAVEIDASCKGMEVVNDADLGGFAGYALRESYNDVHHMFDDDHVIKHIHFEGTFDDSTATTKFLRGGLGSWWWNYGFYYFGGYSCRLCYEPDDDTLAVERKKKQANVHKAWEEGFMALLLKHPDNAFSGITKCHINVIRDQDGMRKAVVTK